MNRYKDGMSKVRLSEEEREQLARQVVQAVKSSTRRNRNRTRRLLFPVAVSFVLLLIATLFLPPLWPNHGDDRMHPGTERSSALFRGFAVTVYAADGTPVTVQPEASFPIGQYSTAMSSAPGFPIQVTADEADAIHIASTDGHLLLWSAPSYKVRDQGHEVEIKPGETVYWSPLPSELEKNHDLAEPIQLTLTAYKDGSKVGTAFIDIESQGYVYTGKLVEK
ncbi:hypothetical protein [Gorillibacterium timonense]|uniref:hypothetical protein n=1 Tax=Gorillibacterium timonense TaxID=1689269 RepID=UPI00071E3EB1|nr:hypothetical protein [Gorillibacterium timonense]